MAAILLVKNGIFHENGMLHKSASFSNYFIYNQKLNGFQIYMDRLFQKNAKL